MHQRNESDPTYVAAMLEAATDMGTMGKTTFQREDWFIGLNKLVELRAAAHGYREVQTFFEAPHPGRRARGARKEARLAAGCAKYLDKLADKLCRTFRIQPEFRGGDDLLAKVLWASYRDIRIEVQDYKLTWTLIAMGCAANKELRDTIAHDHCVPTWFSEDSELLSVAHDAAAAFNSLVYSYRAARERGLSN